MSKMKTIVTGGAGFIGSNLVKALLDSHRDVTVIDNLSRGSVKNLPPNIDLITVDLTNLQDTLRSIQGAETVFHLAARIGSIDYLHGSPTKELVTFQSNTLIDTNVFKACLRNGIKTLIYASSVAIYPPLTGSKVLVVGDLDHNNPDGGYGWAKSMGEIQLSWLDSINIGIARIFNVYGNNSDLIKSPPVISAFMLKVLRGQNISIWGDGLQTRDFIHVSDCTNGLLQLEKVLSKTITTVNIGSGQSISIKTIAERIIKLSGGVTKIVYEPTNLTGPMSQTADITKTKDLLTWKPKVGLDKGLMDTYNWIKEREDKCKYSLIQ